MIYAPKQLSLSRSLFSNISGQGKRDLGSSRKDTGDEDAGNAVSAKSGIDSLHSRGRRNQRRHSDGEADDSNTGGRDDLEAATGDCKWGRDIGSNNAAGVETNQVQAPISPSTPPRSLSVSVADIFSPTLAPDDRGSGVPSARTSATLRATQPIL